MRRKSIIQQDRRLHTLQLTLEKMRKGHRLYGKVLIALLLEVIVTVSGSLALILPAGVKNWAWVGGVLIFLAVAGLFAAGVTMKERELLQQKHDLLLDELQSIEGPASRVPGDGGRQRPSGRRF